MTFSTDDKEPRPRANLPAQYRAALDLWEGRNRMTEALDATLRAGPTPGDIANSGNR